MKSGLDWSDYQVILEISRAGSLAAASRKSGRSHPTLFRRLNAIEHRLGTRLFDRQRNGYSLTGPGEAIVAAAKEFEALANSTERRLSDLDRRPSGLVTVTTTDALFHGLIAETLMRFRKTTPAISVEVRLSNDVHDLSMREADIALRPTSAPEQHLIGRNLGTLRQAIYTRQDQKDNTDLTWVGPSPSMNYVQYDNWLQEQGHDDNWVRVESTMGLYAAVRAGAGRAVLPCYLGDADAALCRCGAVIDSLGIPLWLLVHPDLKRVSRVRALLDFLGADKSLRDRI